MASPYTTRSRLLTGCIFLLIAAIGLISWLGRCHPMANDQDESVVAKSAHLHDESVIGAARANSIEGSDIRQSRANGSGHNELLRGGAAAHRPPPNDARWVDLLIVEKSTGAPQPNALVRWYDDDAKQRFLGEQWYHNSRGEAADDIEYRYFFEDDRWGGYADARMSTELYEDQVADASGWRTRADANGRARVTLGQRYTTVAVENGALYGVIEIRDNTIPPAGGYRVELIPDIALTLRVVDEKGAPCSGVPVGLQEFNYEHRRHRYDNDYASHAVTNEMGLATIPHLQTLCVDSDFGTGASANVTDSSGAKRMAWHARILLFGSRDMGVAFDPAAPPRQPIVLLLPPTGSLRVRAECGGRFAGNSECAQLEVQFGWDRDLPVRDYQTARFDNDGWARFPLVPLGLNIRVYTECFGSISKHCAGPTVRGQEVEVVMSYRDTIVMAGTLLSPDRAPMRNVRINVRSLIDRNPGSDSSSHSTENVTATDSDGRFAISLGAADEPIFVEQLLIDLIDAPARPQGYALRGRMLQAGQYELGEVILEDLPLLVAGEVRADKGPFVGEASVSVERLMPPEGDDQEAEWVHSGLLNWYAREAKGGRFEMYGRYEPGMYRLQVHAQHIMPHNPIPFRLGEKDLRVDLRLACKIAASALLPANSPEDQVRFLLVPSDANAMRPPAEVSDDSMTDVARERHGFITVDANGRTDVQWDGLLPGTYSLRIESWMQGQVLASIPGVVVPPPATPDSRLADIDLRHKLRVVEVAVRGPDGAKLRSYDGKFFATSSHGKAWGETQASSESRLVMPTGPYEVLVCMIGYRPMPLRGDSPRAEVRVEPWPTVAVCFPNLPTLPNRASVRVRLHGPDVVDKPMCDIRYLRPKYQAVDVEKGVAHVPIGDGPHRLTVLLYTDYVFLNGAIVRDRKESDVGVTSEPVTLWPGQATVEVMVPEDNWRKAIESSAKKDSEAGF